MATKTIHVIPDKAKGRWIVKKSGVSVPSVFATRKKATAAAKRLIKGKTGQVVVLTKNGKIIPAASHGLPKVQRPAVRSKIGSKAIEKAVSAVVKARLTSA
jgi:hypothetical protein